MRLAPPSAAILTPEYDAPAVKPSTQRSTRTTPSMLSREHRVDGTQRLSLGIRVFRESRRTFHVRRVTASLRGRMLSTPHEIKSGDFDNCGVAMSAMSQQQSLAHTWKRRQRRQGVLVIVVVAALLAALAYGWLHVFGMF